MRTWLGKHWFWIAAAVVLIVVGVIWGWKLAAKLGGVVAFGGGAALLKSRETREARQTVGGALDRQRRRTEQADRVREESRR